MLNTIDGLDALAYSGFIRLQRSVAITRCSRLVSHTGDGPLYLLLAAGIYWFEPLHYLEFIKSLLMGFVIELPLFMLLKVTIKRDRPFVSLANAAKAIEPSDKFSMPSGHTAAAFLVATTLACFYGEFAVIGFGWAGLIGLSRILLGVHYPGDIIAGGLLGAGSSLLAVEFML